MNEQTAHWVISAGFYIGLAIWILAVRLYGKMARAAAVEQFEATLRGQSPSEAMSRLVGACQPGMGAVSGGLALADGRMERSGDSRLDVKLPTAAIAFDLNRVGGDTQIIATVDNTRYDRIMRMVLALFVLLLMPLVIGGVAVLLWTYVAPNGNPAVRWQCIQILQISHILWPPFLVYFVWKRIHSAVGNAVSNLLVTLEAGA